MEIDIDYGGAENVNNGLKDKFKTLHQCICFCRDLKGPDFFTWNSEEIAHNTYDYACWCKLSNKGRRNVVGSISGKVNDTGMICSFEKFYPNAIVYLKIYFPTFLNFSIELLQSEGVMCKKSADRFNAEKGGEASYSDGFHVFEVSKY